MTTTDRSGSEPVTDPEYAHELGARLRAIREQRRWSLRDVQLASGGRFTGSAVGTYERGERGISVQRLSELAMLYGVPVDQFLPETAPDRRKSSAGVTDAAAGAAEPPKKVVIDLVALERCAAPGIENVRHYVDAIKLKRGDFNGRMLSVRGADVWAWAAMSSLGTDAFVQTLDRLEVLRQS